MSASDDIAAMDARIAGVKVAGTDDGPLPVVLVDVGESGDVLPIFIAFEEALSIARGIDAADVGRPLTHDLTLDLVEELGGRIDRVLIRDVEAGTYYADLHVQTPRGEAVVDARPSDSLALASRTDAPIRVAESVFETGRRARGEFDDLRDIREVAQ